MSIEIKQNNLSAKRGKHGGIWFFRILVRLGGEKIACAFVWPIAFFYALFDCEAKRRINRYIRIRFPQAGAFRRLLHRTAIFATQGQILILAQTPGGLVIDEADSERLYQLVEQESGGLIIVTSHFGPWQSSMDMMSSSTRRVAVMEQPDLNAQITKYSGMRAKERISFIDTASFMGGLMESIGILEDKGVVCIMGDRAGGGEPLELEFLGEKLQITASPWLLAGRCNAAVLPVFAVLNKRKRRLNFVFDRPIRVGDCAGGRLPRQILIESAQKYICQLEQMALDYPYQMFYFEDNKKEGQNG